MILRCYDLSLNLRHSQICQSLVTRGEGTVLISSFPVEIEEGSGAHKVILGVDWKSGVRGVVTVIEGLSFIWKLTKCKDFNGSHLPASSNLGSHIGGRA